MDLFYESNCARSMRPFSFLSPSLLCRSHMPRSRESVSVRVLYSWGEWRLKETEERITDDKYTAQCRVLASHGAHAAYTHREPWVYDGTSRWCCCFCCGSSLHFIFSLAGWPEIVCRTVRNANETAHEKTYEPLIWCDSRRDVGTGYTHDCRSSGQIAFSNVHELAPAGSAWYTYGVWLAWLRQFVSALKSKNDMVYNSLIIFLLNMHFIVFHSSTE